MLQRSWRLLLIGCGMLALALGIVGIFLPLLPTTPFLLVAAFFFSKGSERLHRWLVQHPRFGRFLRDWEAEQVVPLAGKYAATLTMVPLVGWTRELSWILALTMAMTVLGTLWFIWTRPPRRSVPPEESDVL